MEDQMLIYLETFGQPQSVAAIAEYAAPKADRAEVEGVLDSMVAQKVIRRVQAGVHSNGEPTLEYAPYGFKS